ncbi:MAG: ATP-dependent RecD-like DNA helicase [Clostridia bacterium]|nr:ATP-dependent RecD-like DNA helicase [Clostridia bacterium]
MNENIYEEKITGIVENVVFHNSTNFFTVIEVNISGEIITAVGTLSDIAPGEEVVLYGTWGAHEVFGRQFKISSCERSLPDTTAKLYRYLASGAIKGIGPKTAIKIIERFGEQSFEVLESEPEKLAAISGISKQKALDISAEFNRQYAMRKIMIELENVGITPAECTAIYKYFGMNAVKMIKDNPYILCGTVNGFSFERAEKLVEDMGLSPEPSCRNAAGMLHIIRHNLYNGHTCIPRRKMAVPAKALLEIEEETANSSIDELLARKQLISCEIYGEEFLFLPEIYLAEMAIAERMKNILKFPPSLIKAVEADIERIEEENGIFYAEKQKEAIITAATKGLLILTGGPGTGKTTAVKGIIDVFERKRVEVLLCAPTGRAAKRMSEVTGREAKTIHRLLEVEWDANDKPAFRRNAENPLVCGAIIIDEMSMVDTELFASLLDALPMGCRIVLVGDSDQLPSVGPGNVLNDLVDAGILPVVCLTEIFRQAQKSLIVMNAHRIMSGEMPTLGVSDSDFFFMRREDVFSASDTVLQLISKRLPDAYGFSPFDDIQILCPSRKGDLGTVNLNRRLQAVLNPPDRTKNELKTSGGRIFREGDRVMQIKNNYDIPWNKGSEEGEGIFNGDIGILKKINYAAGIMKIEFDDRVADYPSDNLSELELAYAITVHKSQGSEYPVVIMPVIDCPSMLMYRNLLYTGVTRAKKILVLVGIEDKIYSMAANNKQNKRYSALKEFLLA